MDLGLHFIGIKLFAYSESHIRFIGDHIQPHAHDKGQLLRLIRRPDPALEPGRQAFFHIAWGLGIQKVRMNTIAAKHFRIVHLPVDGLIEAKVALRSRIDLLHVHQRNMVVS